MSEKAQNTDHSFVVPQLPHFHPHSAGGHQESLGAGQNTKIPAPLTDLHPIANRFVVEVLKNGLICETVNVNKSVVVIGRALDCDIVLQHPSLSRYHAAIMWKENQAQPNDKNGFFYLMDLHSAHGTFLNKQRLDENKCVKLIVGNNVIRVGGSTRTLILSKIQTDDEEEDDDEQFVESQRKTQESGCRWGMQMEPDDVEPTESSEADDLLNNPVESLQQLIASKVKLESTKNSEVYVENAQKVIQQWFESEGFVFEYRIETFNEQMKCTLSFPIEGQDVEISGDLSMKVSIHCILFN